MAVCQSAKLTCVKAQTYPGRWQNGKIGEDATEFALFDHARITRTAPPEIDQCLKSHFWVGSIPPLA
jgi:hypothetical protein